MKKKILIMGGDGFCGWPTSLGLSNDGCDVTIVDNLSRRKIDIDLECDSLTPIESITKRLQVWKDISGKKISYYNIDIACEYQKLLDLIITISPDVIIHFAEQRSAPYSMKNSNLKRYTVNNNTNATHNVLCSIVESGLDIHLVHLGTMGVYGYGTADLKIPEGYLNVQVDVEGELKNLDILYPANPGSIYHMTKTTDALMFAYYNKNDNVRITDLHQGIVWGTNTVETKMAPELVNRFDYDGDYGTVLNRFLMQAAIEHPLTVYGTGKQTRAFIHINDTVNCIRLAITNAPDHSERVQIYNQMTETHTLINLANIVAKLTGAEIRYYHNPRKEDTENTLMVQNDSLISLGLEPITLENGLLSEVYDIAKKYQSRCDEEKIICKSLWNREYKVDLKGSEKPV